MEKKKIAIIGTGHIGRALFYGLIRKGGLNSSQIILTNHHPEKLNDLARNYGVTITTDNGQAIECSRMALICVKPDEVRRVIHIVREKLDQTKLIISVAACLPLDLLEDYIGNHHFQIMRIMPNIPVDHGEGVIGWLDNGRVRKSNLLDFKRVFSRLGLLIKCSNDEELERLSMIAGCGIGYVAYFIESLACVAQKYGFSVAEAQKIAKMVFFGTINHLKTTNQTTKELITSVATKGGITEEVLRSLDEGRFLNLFRRSINNGFRRVQTVTDELRKES